MTKHLTALIAVAAVCGGAGLIATPADAATKGVDYTGKTKEGSKITFTVNGRWIDRLTTGLPTTCVSAQGGTPQVRIETIEPPYRFALGYEAKVADKSSGITRTYTVTTKRNGRRITGTIKESYSLLANNTFSGYHILTCYGTASFSVTAS